LYNKINSEEGSVDSIFVKTEFSGTKHHNIHLSTNKIKSQIGSNSLEHNSLQYHPNGSTNHVFHNFKKDIVGGDPLHYPEEDSSKTTRYRYDLEFYDTKLFPKQVVGGQNKIPNDQNRPGNSAFEGELVFYAKLKIVEEGLNGEERNYVEPKDLHKLQLGLIPIIAKPKDCAFSSVADEMHIQHDSCINNQSDYRILETGEKIKVSSTKFEDSIVHIFKPQVPNKYSWVAEIAPEIEGPTQPPKSFNVKLNKSSYDYGSQNVFHKALSQTICQENDTKNEEPITFSNSNKHFKLEKDQYKDHQLDANILKSSDKAIKCSTIENCESIEDSRSSLTFDEEKLSDHKNRKLIEGEKELLCAPEKSEDLNPRVPGIMNKKIKKKKLSTVTMTNPSSKRGRKRKISIGSSSSETLGLQKTLSPHINACSNLVKNYGKAMATFAISDVALPYLEPFMKQNRSKANYEGFQEFIYAYKENIESIESLREVLVIKKEDPQEIAIYKNIFKELCKIFLKYFAVNWIFNGRMTHKKDHLNYRFRLMRRVSDPSNFTYLK